MKGVWDTGRAVSMHNRCWKLNWCISFGCIDDNPNSCGAMFHDYCVRFDVKKKTRLGRLLSLVDNSILHFSEMEVLQNSLHLFKYCHRASMANLQTPGKRAQHTKMYLFISDFVVVIFSLTTRKYRQAFLNTYHTVTFSYSAPKKWRDSSQFFKLLSTTLHWKTSQHWNSSHNFIRCVITIFWNNDNNYVITVSTGMWQTFRVDL